MMPDMLHHHLVPDATLREHGAAIRAATSVAGVRYSAALDDPAGDPAFRYYLMFSDAALAHAAGFGHLDAATLFYNRYYWFQRFARAHAAAHGFDAGLEQQAFQLLEVAPADVDWSIIEAIEARLHAVP